jgi:hypothetical protein
MTSIDFLASRTAKVFYERQVSQRRSDGRETCSWSEVRQPEICCDGYSTFKEVMTRHNLSSQLFELRCLPEVLQVGQVLPSSPRKVLRETHASYLLISIAPSPCHPRLINGTVIAACLMSFSLGTVNHGVEGSLRHFHGTGILLGPLDALRNQEAQPGSPCIRIV